MDGFIAPLKAICDLADKYNAVDFLGRQGRGTHEHCDVMGRIDILTGTLGNARIRTRISAAHMHEDLELAVQASIAVRQELGIHT